MLNTEKLLYILPDLTYLAELLPGKKEHAFSIQSFRQINGEFIDDNEFISNNIQKLFTKIDKEEYHLILPDFLFTNTIVTVNEDTKSAAEEYVEKQLLPDLEISEETHEIEITFLTSLKGSSKVQISALEKNLLSPLRVAAKKSGITIKAISPLSWAIKSIVSLEPSITVLQIGNNLYSAQQYIGIDQTNNFPLDEFNGITETIKTLKGAEPSIQTIYLVSSVLIEEKIKDDLSGTLPIQQLATYKEDDTKIPSYIKYIIESCMKTLSIVDFPVPRFNLGVASKEEEDNIFASETAKTLVTPDKNLSTNENEKLNSKNPAPTDLPEPSKVPQEAVVARIEEAATMPEDKKVEEEVIVSDLKEETDDTKETEIVEETTKKDISTVITIEEPTEEEIEEVKKIAEEKKVDNNDSIDLDSTDSDKDSQLGEVNLAQFAGKDDSSDDEVISTKTEEEKEATDIKDIKTTKDESVIDLKNKPQKVIKNSSGVNNMIKMVFITLAVFFITIAIGIGVGLGLLKMSDKTSKEEVAPIVVTESETPKEASDSATTEVVEEKKVDKETVSIYIVNATTKAGYAGKIKAMLTEEEFSKLTAGNAEGEYEADTDYVLMNEEDTTLITTLEAATGLELKFSSETKIEDPDGKYDAIIVLAK